MKTGQSRPDLRQRRHLHDAVLRGARRPRRRRPVQPIPRQPGARLHTMAGQIHAPVAPLVLDLRPDRLFTQVHQVPEVRGLRTGQQVLNDREPGDVLPLVERQEPPPRLPRSLTCQPIQVGHRVSVAHQRVPAVHPFLPFTCRTFRRPCGSAPVYRARWSFRLELDAPLQPARVLDQPPLVGAMPGGANGGNAHPHAALQPARVAEVPRQAPLVSEYRSGLVDRYAHVGRRRWLPSAAGQLGPVISVGLCPTPAYIQNEPSSSPGLRHCGCCGSWPSGRHRCTGTTPGSSSSKPSRRRSTSAWLRSVGGSAIRCRIIAMTSSASAWLVPSPVMWDSTRWLPGAIAWYSRATIACGSSLSVTKCSTATASTHTGLMKSITSVTSGWVRIACGSRMSACTTLVGPFPASSAWACTITSGS